MLYCICTIIVISLWKLLPVVDCLRKESFPTTKLWECSHATLIYLAHVQIEQTQRDMLIKGCVTIGLVFSAKLIM